jgi:hypothetical protein
MNCQVEDLTKLVDAIEAAVDEMVDARITAEVKADVDSLLKRVTPKPDPMNLNTLISWLEMQPPEKPYCYTDGGNCLLTQYFTAMGFKKVVMFSHKMNYFDANLSTRVYITLSRDFHDIPLAEPRTFGAALDRARSLRGK